MLISFMYVPLLLHSMTPESYAIWLTLTSLVSWISMFDIGLGNGLRNKVAIALANKNILLARTYVSTAYFFILALVLALIGVFCLIHHFVSWDIVLKASNESLTELNTLVLIVFISFLLNFSLNLINSLLYALQLPALSSFISFISQLFSFIIVYGIVNWMKVTSLLMLGSVISVIPPIISLLFSLYLFLTKLKHISPSIKYYNLRCIKEILSLGLKFFLLQIITLVLFQANSMIILHFIGKQEVVIYNVAYKYMSILVIVFNMIATPLWSATTEAYTRGDFSWIRSVNKKMKLIVLFLFVAGIFMFIFSENAYLIWLGESDVYIGKTTTLLLLFYAFFMMLYGTYGYILNGIGKLNLQILITTIMAVLYIPMTYIGCLIAGLNGILFVFLLVSIINFVWSKIQYHRLLNKTATGIWNS